MLLSSDEYHGFKIYQSPRLIELMLAHIGFFGLNSSNNYRYLYDNAWNDYSKQEEYDSEKIKSNNYPESFRGKRKNFVKFWHNAVQLPEDENKNLISQLLPELYNQCKFR